MLARLSSYTATACEPRLRLSPRFRTLSSAPWELLSFAVTDGLLHIGGRHDSLRAESFSAISSYLGECERAASRLRYASGTDGAPRSKQSGLDVEAQDVLAIATSLVGFLDASSQTVHLWHSTEQRDTLSRLGSLVSENLLLALEAAVSNLSSSTSHSQGAQEWKHYLTCYSANGKPLGSLRVRQSYMYFAEVCASALIMHNHPIQEQDVLSLLLNGQDLRTGQRCHSELVDMLVVIATETIVDLEEENDYLRMGPSWQQRRLCQVKSSAFICFTCCHVLNEDLAQKQSLVSWLESTLADPTQASDDRLACTTLRCLAVLALTEKDIALSLTKSIPRFLTQGNMDITISHTAATSLLVGLRAVPQDSVITTLYNLGNSIKPQQSNNATSSVFMFDDLGAEDDNADAKSPVINGGAKQASSASLSPDESSKVATAQAPLIRAIVVVANGFGDERLAALALPMLIQKVGKLDIAVDIEIISQAALLVVNAGSHELRALLRLYADLSHEAVLHHNEEILDAVRPRTFIVDNH